ncbi:hypothetical protein EYF80_034594 [Liparis tanakae]|uniref:Uncharacterized protein n=1 Tax=Liparis tanakae TaxID=230148 RepID=A0A4Z2GP71_9TELE|nr:hypothetical protein EYF80_034594 [Liparis tanakae]
MEEILEKIFLIKSGGNEPRPASSVRLEQKTCGGSKRDMTLHPEKGCYACRVQDSSLPRVLRGDPLAGLLSSSPSALGLMSGSDPLTLEQALPQLTLITVATAFAPPRPAVRLSGLLKPGPLLFLFFFTLFHSLLFFLLCRSRLLPCLFFRGLRGAFSFLILILSPTLEQNVLFHHI